MVRLAFSCVLIVFFAFASARVDGQEQTRVAVEVIGDADDPVGERFIYNLKEEFRKSAAFRLTVLDEPRVKLIVQTMARFRDQKEAATMYSVVWTYEDKITHPIYWDSTLGFAGADVVGRAAQTIVARTDSLISSPAKLKKLQTRSR